MEASNDAEIAPAISKQIITQALDLIPVGDSETPVPSASIEVPLPMDISGDFAETPTQPPKIEVPGGDFVENSKNELTVSSDVKLEINASELDPVIKIPVLPEISTTSSDPVHKNEEILNSPPKIVADSKLDKVEEPQEVEMLSSRESSRPGTATSKRSKPVNVHGMSLPHAPGSIPKYLTKAKAGKGSVVELAKVSSQFSRSDSFVTDPVSDVKPAKNPRWDSGTNTASSVYGSNASLASTKNNPTSMSTPHKLGEIPAYIKKKQPTEILKSKTSYMERPSTASVPSPLNSLENPEVSSPSENEVESLKKQVHKLNIKGLENTKKNAELSKDREQFRQKLQEAEEKISDKEKELSDLKSRLKVVSAKTKTQRDNTEKLQDLENHINSLKKANQDLEKNFALKDEEIAKMKAENQKSKRDLTEKLKSSEAEKNNLKKQLEAVKNDGKQQKFELLESQMKLRDSEIAELKNEIKTLSKQQDNKIRPDAVKLEDLHRELLKYKSIEQEKKQEILTLTSKLDDERHKIYRIENLLQLRGEYIKTLQETDEVHKARIVLQIKDIEDLQVKLAKAKKFKAATNEELANLHNTLTRKDFEITRLKHEIEKKDAKLLKFTK